jgi:hypothetical protein
MLPAVPSAENLDNKNSKVVNKIGKAKIAYHGLPLRMILRAAQTMSAKITESKTVKTIAGTMVATVTRYENQLNLPIK